jgi:outer membrane receptor protein involved in Fe transport
MKQLLAVFLLLSFNSFSQITGTIVDKSSNEPVIGAKIIASNGAKTLSKVDGSFSIPVNDSVFPINLVISMLGYQTDTIRVESFAPLTIKLSEPVQKIETVVVSAGRRAQEIEEIAISMEIIRPELVDNKGVSTLEEAVNQSPGVYAMDGQVSIRGGSGYSYGSGSRVMILWNGMPLLSGEASDTKWNAIPIELASQIEVMKGASSVLYGAGALNGIISLSEREPGLKGEVRAKYQIGIYDSPKRASLKWWSKSPTFQQIEAYYGKMYKKVGFTISANGYATSGFREGEKENRARISGTFYFRPKRIERLKAGIGYNIQYQNTGSFLIWESDSLGYQPSGGAVESDSASTIGFYTGVRLSIDPYIKYIDKYKNKHNLKTRYYLTDNTNIYNGAQSNRAGILFADYQFQRTTGFGMTITTGTTITSNKVSSNLFGDHSSINAGLYLQAEQKLFKKLDLTFGVRAEYFEQDNTKGDSDYYFGKDSSKIPFYPIIRGGLHYELFKYTHLRASYGQGIRYPSIAERYTQANVGALNSFPNPNLTPEKGWAAEVGIKQVFKIGKNWKGIFDVAGFINQYSNMMEFVFGNYLPDSLTPSLTPGNPGYLGKWIGFQSQNSERARITGLELSFNSIGKIGEVELTSLLGYTYMQPITLNSDKNYVKSFSTYEETVSGVDTTYTFSNILKYRFTHLIKGDIEATWKKISLGFSGRYNSNMENIDKIFEESIVGTYILPGLKEYRKNDNKGALVFDARLGYTFKEHYRVGFIVNNVFNREYSTRPGDIQAPRNFIFQLQVKF